MIWVFPFMSIPPWLLALQRYFFAGIVWIACVLVADSGPSGPLSCGPEGPASEHDRMAGEHLHAAHARHEQEGACEPHAAK